jgi:hypothetical protein
MRALHLNSSEGMHQQVLVSTENEVQVRLE